MALPVEKDGSTFMHIEKMDFDIEPQGCILKIDNLFNGDKVLGDNMNLFLNENWKEIFEELRTSMRVAFGAVTKKIINRVFTTHPFEKYFAI